ncbi:hypothetical protein TNCV_3020951 [Trichonephila clavipes]|nr:hypothetical protein TNCV_3020951 [Trichonephila clavipes]
MVLPTGGYRHRETTPTQDCYLTLIARRHRRTTFLQFAREFPGKVYRRLAEHVPYARRVCNFDFIQQKRRQGKASGILSKDDFLDRLKQSVRILRKDGFLRQGKAVRQHPKQGPFSKTE